jgi:DNA-binding MarR family transcriptional regulator
MTINYVHMHLMSEKTTILTQFDVTDVSACTCANLRQAARVVTQAYNGALRPVDLRATQFSILANLISPADMPLTRLAQALVMDRTTLTRNLKPLIRRKLVRIEHEEDRRVRNVVLTDAGRKIFAEALPLWQQVQTRISEGLGQKRWSGLLEDLTATVSIFQDR